MKDKQGNEIEITFERSYPPLRFGNKEEARLATMTQRLQTFAGDVGYVVLHAAWDPSVKADYDKIMDQLDRTVQLERDQLKLAFNKLICDEKKQIVVKEDDYLWQGLVTIIHQWIKINRQFPYSDHPEFDSIGFEMACETLCSFYNVDCPARKEALNWLEPYLPHLNEMTEERDELYVDAVTAASSKEDHRLLLRVRDQLPARLEPVRERIDLRLSEFKGS